MVDGYRSIDSLIPIQERKRIIFPDDNFYNFNFSILEGTNKVAFRNSDFPPQTNVAGKCSFISIGNLVNDQLEDLSRIRFRGYGFPLWDRYNGMEDPKLFNWLGDDWCLFVRPNHSISKIIMVMLNLDSGKHIFLDDPEGRPFTKNWMPYVDGDKLYFVVDVDPLNVYELVDDRLVNVYKSNRKIDNRLIHGGSNLIELGGRLVCLVHGMFETDQGKWFYWHSLMSCNKDWTGQKLGRSFYFEKEGIEFSLSVSRDGSDILIPYSVHDDGVSILRIEENNFKGLL